MIGDSCIDEYQYGVVDRISPEAPVPVFKYLYSEEKPGMALNVKANLEKLPVEVTLITDTPSRKVRMIDTRTKHHLLRVDTDHVCKEPLTFETVIPSFYDAVVVSDYDKGFITYELLEELGNGSIYLGPVYIDTKKKDLARLKNCIVKINEQERNACISTCENLIVTMGAKGSIYKDKLYESSPVEVSDVCGAGDTYLAALVYWHLFTGNLKLAIPFANKAAAVTVQHFGTYAPEMKEYL